MQTLLKYKITALGLLMGAIAGYAYYYFVGCASGTCSITSSPVNSTLYGAMMGGIFLHSFETENKNENQ